MRFVLDDVYPAELIKDSTIDNKGRYGPSYV